MLIARVSLLETVDREVVNRFHGAASDGDVNVVIDMLRDGVSVDCSDEYGQTALYWAAVNNRIDIVKVLLDSGANVNWQNCFGITPLMDAAR